MMFTISRRLVNNIISLIVLSTSFLLFLSFFLLAANFSALSLGGGIFHIVPNLASKACFDVGRCL